MNASVFIERLCEKRKCTKSSANTHFLTIKRIFRMVKGWDRLRPVEKIPKTSSWLSKGFFTKLKGLTPLVQRNLLVSAVVYLQFTKASKTKVKEFTTKMYDLVKEIRQERKKSGFTLNDKQKKMWVGKTALNEKWKELYNSALSKARKMNWSRTDENNIRDGVLLSIFTGKGVPVPRLDWYNASFQDSAEPAKEGVTSIHQKNKRWMVSYGGKTRKTYGVSTFPIHNPVLVLIKRVKRRRDMGDPLFLTNRGRPFTKSSFGAHVKKLLQKTFDRPVTASFMRHLYVSHRFEGLPKLLEEFEKQAEQMTHSSDVQLKDYLKKNDS